MEPVDPVRVHGLLRPPGRLGRDRLPRQAYPRGYKNAGVDKLEPFEVRDAKPAIDPVRKGD